MISIILPTHNDSQYLVKAIASCLVQDVQSEILVIDDASTDPINDVTMNTINLFCRYILNEKNLGLAGSRNVGIKAACGKFLYMLDADDWIMPHILGKLSNAMQNNDVVFGNLTAKDDDVVHKPAGWNGVTKEKLLKDNPVWCGSLYRKSKLLEVGGYDEYPFANYEDFRLHCKLFKAGAKFKYLDRIIYRHTEREGSMLSDLHNRTEYWKKFAQKPLL